MRETARTFLPDLWALTKPYWFSEERWAARGLLAVIVALNLGLVYYNVLYTRWFNDFYNALQNKDVGEFYSQLWRFSYIAFASIVIGVYQVYLNQMLQIRWRTWLTNEYLGAWIGDRSYYRMQLADRGTDNPDQRIAEDLRIFCDKTLNLALDLLSSVVSLVTFTVILWTLSGPFKLTIGSTPVEIPGYLVWAALIYAIAGTLLVHFIGRALIQLNFNQQKYEAGFRFALMRFRENAESIALYAGEAGEIRNLRQRFSNVVANWWEIMKRQKKLTWMRTGYTQIALIFPFLVAGPRYLAGEIQLGGLMQIGTSFDEVRKALSWFIDAYTQLAEWRATVDRLTTFRNAAVHARQQAQTSAGVTIAINDGGNYSARDVHVELPGGEPLLAPFNLEIRAGESVLVTGPSGSGKSTLFRALAGIWPFGGGTVTRPPGGKVLFLPQKPYLTIGTLREQLCYPAAGDACGDDELRAVLVDCRLAYLAGRLDEEQHWAQILSGGEQQRVAFARALLHKPDWLFMDEATSALDEATETALYRLLRQRLPQCTIVSIGHRASLRPMHGRHLEIRAEGSGAGTLQWAA